VRLLSTSLLATVSVTLLAGCSSSMSPSASVPGGGIGAMGASHATFAPHYFRVASVVPEQLRPIGPMPLRGRPAPAKAQGGIYVSEFTGTSILGYKSNNKKNGPPSCSVGTVSDPNGIAVDNEGNLIEPDGGTRNINIFRGPGMCGPKIASISDGFGQPSDAASANAMTGEIVVGNIFDDDTGLASISVCTIKKGCTSNHINPAMNEVAGVALDNQGNCWASSDDLEGDALLVYFAHCKGRGVIATGFQNATFGGLDIDSAGNLVSIDSRGNGTGQVFVYKGCNPACSLVGGPFALHGEAVFGHVNKMGTSFAAADITDGQIDIYKYAPTALTYMYSFNNGLSASLTVTGVAYNPRSTQ
jgi:hypothetical protein